MSFELNGKTLYEKIRHLAPIARKGKQPHHRNVRLRCPTPRTVEFAIVGDLLSIRTYARIARGEGFDDDAWVDGDVLYKLSRKLTKRDVSFERLHDSGDLVLTAGNVATTFSASDGVRPEEATPEASFTMPAELFAKVMAEALPYASNDDSRPTLCGVFVDCPNSEPNVTATNGHVLYTRRLSADEWTAELPSDGIILPDVAVRYALKLVDASGADIVIGVGDSRLVIEQPGNFRTDTDVIEGSFPDFRQCLPKGTGRIAEFDAGEMREALKLASPFLGKSNAVRVIYNGSVQLQVDADAAGQFDADVRGSYSEDSPARLSFNADYLQQACDTVGGEVRQYVGDTIEPQVFARSDDRDEQLRVVVMPMRL